MSFTALIPNNKYTLSDSRNGSTSHKQKSPAKRISNGKTAPTRFVSQTKFYSIKMYERKKIYRRPRKTRKTRARRDRADQAARFRLHRQILHGGRFGGGQESF